MLDNLLLYVTFSYPPISPPVLPLFGAPETAMPIVETTCKKLLILTIQHAPCVVFVDCDLICCSFVCHRKQLLGFVYCTLTLRSLVYLHVAKTNSSPNAPAMEALETDVPSRGKARPTLTKKKTDSRPIS